MTDAPAGKAPLWAIVAAAIATGGVVAFAAVLGVRRRVLEADGSEHLVPERERHHPEVHPWLAFGKPKPEARLRAGGFVPRPSPDLDPTPLLPHPIIKESADA